MPNVFLSGTVTNTTVPTTLTGSVGPNSSSVIVNPNAKRMSLVIVNDGTNNAYIALGKSGSAGMGIRLNSGGGSYEINSTNLYTGTVAAATRSGTTTFTIMEMLTE